LRVRRNAGGAGEKKAGGKGEKSALKKNFVGHRKKDDQEGKGDTPS
jgi:hypothetical protein